MTCGGARAQEALLRTLLADVPSAAQVLQDKIRWCYYKEGVNHYELCKDLAASYLELLKVRLRLRRRMCPPVPAHAAPGAVFHLRVHSNSAPTSPLPGTPQQHPCSLARPLAVSCIVADRKRLFFRVAIVPVARCACAL